MVLLNAVPSVGVIVPTLGTREKWLVQCLESLASQKGARLEIVVVGPRGNLLHLENSYRLQVIEETGRSLSQAINQGYAELKSRVDYITWLGDDDALTPGSLSLALGELEAHPEVAMVFGRTLYVDGAGAIIYRGAAGRWIPHYMRIGQDYLPQPGSLIRTHSIRHWLALVDDNLANAMDLDLFLRLMSEGMRLRSTGHLLSYYRIHDGAITSSKGALDESAGVRRRYLQNRLAIAWSESTVLRPFLERAFVWRMWHLPQLGVRKGEVPNSLIDTGLRSD